MVEIGHELLSTEFADWSAVGFVGRHGDFVGDGPFGGRRVLRSDDAAEIVVGLHQRLVFRSKETVVQPGVLGIRMELRQIRAGQRELAIAIPLGALRPTRNLL